ncbi:thioredoxin domain-containing protein [Lentibacillus cibarius]|uniref:Thioredoxin domain-containing protein n=1 Tax=Lentibacillus cibarius TaxID=2583219 RepID=A0A549YFH7_9BACI|nr:thioredoxin domain-containing protein [Lentibacillus cibarius]TRM10597.1 thioredoxin domain-containing protein [Lentibacillus cibarius]
MTSNKQPNNLIIEKSPYLMQHAYAQVNWYTWGEEAFAKAKAENKPIFLFIGYLTCRLCRQMAHESFADEEVAAFLNAHFISILVDREERPDIESAYRKACQMPTGQSDSPLSIFMTPDSVPFFADTYIPRNGKFGAPGFLDTIQHLSEAYQHDPASIKTVTDSVHTALQQTKQTKSQARLSSKFTISAYQLLSKRFDASYGGFGVAPKSPEPQTLLYLLRFFHFTEKRDAWRMVDKTARAMAAGGMYDHVGFGFASGSKDDMWRVPYAEKMLYDNALLLMVYTECYQLTKKPFYQEKADEIIAFIKREMTSPEGAFYSMIDAEENDYLWDDKEITDILGSDLAALYQTAYNITPNGNDEGKHIPNLIHTKLETLANERGESVQAIQQHLESARAALLAKRQERAHPLVDDRILAAWNGYMIAALAKAGAAFGNPAYIEMAATARTFIQENMVKHGRLMARFRDGEVKHQANLDDYANLLWASIELYGATFSLTYLQQAKDLFATMTELFWDNEFGGFYFSGRDSEPLIARDKIIYDGSRPSGNAVAAVMATRLGFLTGETQYLDMADHMHHTFFQDIKEDVIGSPMFLESVILTDLPTKEVVIIGKENDPNRVQLLEQLHKEYLPHVTVLAAEHASEFQSVAPFASALKQVENQTTIYICQDFKCQEKTTDIEQAYNAIVKK